MAGAIRKKLKAGVGVAKDGLDAALLALDLPRIDKLMSQVENLAEAGPGAEADLARALAARIFKRVRSVRDSLVATVKSPKKSYASKARKSTKAKKAKSPAKARRASLAKKTKSKSQMKKKKSSKVKVTKKASSRRTR